MVEMLQGMEADGSLNHTVLFLLGDHGQRVDKIKTTTLGRFEERLPLLTVRFPSWWERLHPEKVASLRRNRYRHITNFDLHATLHHIVNGTAPRETSGAMSLLQDIPVSRTCKDTKLPPLYCTCMVEGKERSDTAGMDVLKNWLHKHCPGLKEPVFKHVVTLRPNPVARKGDGGSGSDRDDLIFLDATVWLSSGAGKDPLTVKLRYKESTCGEKLTINVPPVLVRPDQPNVPLKTYCANL